MPLLGVVQCVLVGRPGHTQRLGTHGWTGGLEGLHGRLGVALFTSPYPSQALLELFLAAQKALPWNPHVVQQHLGGVAGPYPVLLVLLALAQPDRPGRDDERGVPLGTQLRVDHGHHHVHVGDPPVCDPRLGTV